MTTRISHWIGGAARAGTSGRTGPVFNPATGEQTGAVDLASAAERRRRRRRRRRGRAASGAPPSLSRRSAVLFALPRAAARATPTSSPRSSPPSTARCSRDAAGEVARGLENVEFACGVPQLLKGGYSEQAATGVDVYSIRQPLGVVAGITPFNFPAMVPLWMCANAIACGNAFILKPSEKDPSASLFLAELWQQAGLPDGVFTVVHGDKDAVDALLDTPRHRRGQLRRLDADRALHLRDRHRGTASGCRPSAARRTTWSCCPTPTSTWPPTPRCPPPTARRASAAWPSRSRSRSATSATGWSTRSQSRLPKLRIGDGADPDTEMGPLITAEHRDKVAGYIDGRRRRPARSVVVDGREADVPDRRLLPRHDAARPRRRRR